MALHVIQLYMKVGDMMTELLSDEKLFPKIIFVNQMPRPKYFEQLKLFPDDYATKGHVKDLTVNFDK